MNEEGYLISKDSATRLSGMLDAFDNNQIAGQWRPDRGDYGFGRTTSIVQTVRVTALISAGYYAGQVRNWDQNSLSWVAGPDCRVKEVGGGALTVGVDYPNSKLIGVETASGTNYLIFLAKASSGGASMGYYNGGTVSLSGGTGFGYTEVTLLSGGTLKLNGVPWGKTALGWFQSNYYTQKWWVIIHDLNDYTNNYSVVPFTISKLIMAAAWFQSDYDGYATTGGANPLYAWDPLKLVPYVLGGLAAGWFPVILQTCRPAYNGQNVGFQVINCRPYDMANQWFIPPIYQYASGLGSL